MAKGGVIRPAGHLLSRPDGTATANVVEMDGLLHDVWRPINCKYATDSKPDPTAFI